MFVLYEISEEGLDLHDSNIESLSALPRIINFQNQQHLFSEINT